MPGFMPDFFKDTFGTTINYATDAREFIALRNQIATVKQQNFDHQNPLHTGLLNDSTAFFIKKRDALQTLDRHIITGLAIGMAASIASLILPLSTIAIGCFAYSCYCLGARTQAQQEYHAALDQLVECCQWSLGNAAQIEESASIKNMIATLAPPTTNEQLRSFVSITVADQVCQLADEAENASMLNTFGSSLDKNQTNAYQSLYGYQKGGVLDAIKTLYYFAKQAVLWGKNKFTSQQAPLPVPTAEESSTQENNSNPTATAAP